MGALAKSDDENGVLVKLDQARAFLVEAQDLQTVKQVRDQAMGLEVFARESKAGEELVRKAGEIQAWAEKRLGELLDKIPDAKTGPKKLGSEEEPNSKPPTLAELGIDKKLSSRAQTLASITDKKFEGLLKSEPKKELSVVGIAKAIKAELNATSIPPVEDNDPCCTTADLLSLVNQGSRFGCIYADPPWQYSNQGTRAATDNHYPTMTIDEIAGLPIPELADEKCHLHLWTTNGFLRDALKLIEKWRFEFKSTFVWVKPQLGLGNYWRCSHEILLLGVRGGLTFPASNVPSWIKVERTKHSAKPEAVRALIERMSPGPRIELFGRKLSPGWTVWGNQISRSLFDPREAA